MTYRWRGIASSYAERLPQLPKDKEKLGDTLTGVNTAIGGTPLIYSRSLSGTLYSRVFLKLEYSNPVLSHYYRGLGIAVPVAQAQMRKAHPQYPAAALRTLVLARPQQPIAEVMRAAALVAARNACSISVIVSDYHAEAGLPLAASEADAFAAELVNLHYLPVSYAQILHAARQIATDYPLAVVALDEPEFFDITKTIAFEIVDLLADAPHLQVVSADYPGQLAAHWLGYREYSGDLSELSVRPDARHLVPQASRQPQLLAASRTQRYYGNDAIAAAESKAQLVTVTADSLAGAHSYLRDTEGLYCGDNAAAAIAALQIYAAEGLLPLGIDIVCTLVDALPQAAGTSATNAGILLEPGDKTIAAALAEALRL